VSQLNFIKSGTGTSFTSFSITDCFTTNYDIFKVVIDTIDIGSTDLKFRFLNSSGVVSSANYDVGVFLMRSYGAFAAQPDQDRTDSGSIGFSDYTDKGGAAVLHIYNPTNSSVFTMAHAQNAGLSTIGTPVRRGAYVLTVAESHTGINFTAASTVTKVSASVYGLKV